MRELVNVVDYDNYVNILNEDLLHGAQSACNKAFINGGPIKMKSGEMVDPRDIVNAVEQALGHLTMHYTRTFAFARKTMNIIYLARSKKHKTMSVDSHMNLYVNAQYVYNHLKLDVILIAAVIMHEVLHAMFNHIERGKNWLASKGKPANNANWHDTNLAADVEVNRIITRIQLVDEDRLINEIKGIYLKKQSGQKDVVLLEQILDNEELMQKLRAMCPPDPDPEDKRQDPPIKTTDEWNAGYKDAWNKLAELIKKYGYKKAWEKLLESGIITGDGELNNEKDIDDIKNLEYLTVKGYDDFVNENLNPPEADRGKTYDDGFVTGFVKLAKKLAAANTPSEPGGGGGGFPGAQGPRYETGMNDEDLEEVDLPSPDNDDESEGYDDGLPDNAKSDGSQSKGGGQEGDDSNGGDGDDNGDGQDGQDGQEQHGGNGESQKSGKSQKSAGKGGQGKSAESMGADDVNTLADDISKRTKGGTEKVKTSQDIEEYTGVGGTGSFERESTVDDDELREAGYSEEDLKKVKEIIKQNEMTNNPAKIEKIINQTRMELDKGDPIRTLLGEIEVESAKYKNIWKKILEEFMAKKTRRAGKDLPNGRNDWLNKKQIAKGEYGLHRMKTAQDPQDVNMYVDVSGSVDVSLLEIIAKSLVIFSQTWKYSAINICPWASKSNGIFKVEGLYKKSEAELSKEIMEYISAGISQCGGGTEAVAVFAAMLAVVKETLNDPQKKKKDDIHVVITDGYFDFENIESRIEHMLLQATERQDVAVRAPENTVWMIYDAPESHREDWIKQIKKGKLIFISSEVVKNNG